MIFDNLISSSIGASSFLLAPHVGEVLMVAWQTSTLQEFGSIPATHFKISSRTNMVVCINNYGG